MSQFIGSPETYLESYSSPVHPQTASYKTSGCDSELMWTHWRTTNKAQKKKETEEGNLHSASKLSIHVTCVATFFWVYRRAAACLSAAASKKPLVIFTLDFRPTNKTWGLTLNSPLVGFLSEKNERAFLLHRARLTENIYLNDSMFSCLTKHYESMFL